MDLGDLFLGTGSALDLSNHLADLPVDWLDLSLWKSDLHILELSDDGVEFAVVDAHQWLDDFQLLLQDSILGNIAIGRSMVLLVA